MGSNLTSSVADICDHVVHGVFPPGRFRRAPLLSTTSQVRRTVNQRLCSDLDALGVPVCGVGVFVYQGGALCAGRS